MFRTITIALLTVLVTAFMVGVGPNVAYAATPALTQEASLTSGVANVLFLVPIGDEIRLRTRPVDGAILEVVNAGEILQVVEPPQTARPKIGVYGEWVKVRTLGGTQGYTAAWLYRIAHAVTPEIAAAATIVTAPQIAAPPSNSAGSITLASYRTDTPTTTMQSQNAALFIRATSSEVRVRERPIDGEIVTVVDFDEIVQVIEPIEGAQTKIGVPERWVEIRTVEGTEGYTAAWLYTIEDTAANAPPATTTVASTLYVTPINDEIRVRETPVDGAVIAVINRGELLEVTEPLALGLPKVGVETQWLAVQTADGITGYTAAWLFEVAEIVDPNPNLEIAPTTQDTASDLGLIPDAEAINADSPETVIDSDVPIPPIATSIDYLDVPDSQTDAVAGAAGVPGAPTTANVTVEQPATDAGEGKFFTRVNTAFAPLAPDAEPQPESLDVELINPIQPVSVELQDDIDVFNAFLALNGYPLAEFNAPPFDVDLDTTRLSEGVYELTFAVIAVDGMQWADTVELEVQIEESPVPAAFDLGLEDATPQDAVTANDTILPAPNPEATTLDLGTDERRRIVTVDGIERPLTFEFSIGEGLVPVTIETQERVLRVDSGPDSLADVITTPLVSVIPAPVREFIMADRPTEATIIILIMSLILIPQGLFTLYWMTYTWNNPRVADEYKSPSEFVKPQHSFTALVPARHEEAVIRDTILAVDRIDYPEDMKEILILIRDEDDDATIQAAQRTIGELGKDNIRLITFTDGPRNKPNGLNKGLRETTKEVVCIFDAEDEPHPDIYNVVNTVMLRDEADVVQSGVQLMNFKSSWFSVFNVLEYFFWFKSGLHAFTRQFNVTPLGGNTVFFKRHWLEKLGGWDDQGLTEDADVGLRLTLLGAKMQIVYDAKHATQEETPDTVESFIKQRTRWSQGFYQIFFKGDWMKLPTFKQRVIALYILLNSLLQAAMILFIPVGLFIALTQDVPVPVALFSWVPIYLLILQLVTSLVGIREFTQAYQKQLPFLFTLRMILFYYPYQLLLSIAAFRALVRLAMRQGSWEKTSHSNLHRQSQLSGV